MCSYKWPPSTGATYPSSDAADPKGPEVLRQSVIVRVEAAAGRASNKRNGKSSSSGSSGCSRKRPSKKLQEQNRTKEAQAHLDSGSPVQKWMSKMTEPSTAPGHGHISDPRSWEGPPLVPPPPGPMSWPVSDFHRYLQYGRDVQNADHLTNYHINSSESSSCNSECPNLKSIPSRQSLQNIFLDNKNCQRMIPYATPRQQIEMQPNSSLELYSALEYERSGHHRGGPYQEPAQPIQPDFHSSPVNNPQGSHWLSSGGFGPPSSSAPYSSHLEMPRDSYEILDYSYGPPPSGSISIAEADNDGDIALHIAVAKEEETNVAHLIEIMQNSRLSIDIFNKLHQTSLHIAVITKNIKVIHRLLMAGACPSLPDRHGNTSIHLAVYCSSLDVLKLLLEFSESLIAIRRYNYSGFTPLHLAVFKRDLDAISLLIAKGADCNCIDGTSGRTPLFHAVLNSQDDVVARLICLGASVNLPNFAGITPLVIATDRRLKNITSLLISKGATVTCREDSAN